MTFFLQHRFLYATKCIFISVSGCRIAIKAKTKLTFCQPAFVVYSLQRPTKPGTLTNRLGGRCDRPERKTIMPTKKYSTILADPPWSINQKGKRGAVMHYQLMSLEDIKNMPVADLAEENAHLWLWIPNGLLQEGLDVMKAWGFKYRDPFYWIKPRLGLGNYLRNASETVLFGTRGKAPVKFKAQPNWLFAPLQDHSHKPEEMYPIIERVSPGPYLELFARRPQPNWDAWGNEIASDVMIPGYPVPEYSDKAKESEEV